MSIEGPKVERLSQLDAIRGFAACVIAFIFHTKVFYDISDNPLADVLIVGWRLNMAGYS